MGGVAHLEVRRGVLEESPSPYSDREIGPVRNVLACLLVLVQASERVRVCGVRVVCGEVWG